MFCLSRWFFNSNQPARRPTLWTLWFPGASKSQRLTGPVPSTKKSISQYPRRNCCRANFCSEIWCFFFGFWKILLFFFKSWWPISLAKSSLKLILPILGLGAQAYILWNSLKFMAGGVGSSESDTPLTQTEFHQLFFFTVTCLVIVFCLFGATNILETGLVFDTDKLPVMFLAMFFSQVLMTMPSSKSMPPRSSQELNGVARSCPDWKSYFLRGFVREGVWIKKMIQQQKLPNFLWKCGKKSWFLWKIFLLKKMRFSSNPEIFCDFKVLRLEPPVGQGLFGIFSFLWSKGLLKGRAKGGWEILMLMREIW